MEYLSAKEIAKKWNITTRQVQKLCATGRIPEAKRLGDGKVWLVPDNAKKPPDLRYTSKHNQIGEIKHDKQK